MTVKISGKKLLEKIKKLGKNAKKLQRFFFGKIKILTKCGVYDFNDFGIKHKQVVAESRKTITKI